MINYMKLVYNPNENAQGDQNREKPVVHYEDNVKKSGKFQREKIKDKPFKEKAAYYLEYYKYPALAVVVGGILLFTLIRSIVTSKSYCFNGMMVNSMALDSQTISSEFARIEEFDTDKYECFIDCDSLMSINGLSETDLATSTKFIAQIQTKDLDIATFDSTNFETEAMGECMMDLSSVLSAEDLERFKDKLYYIDYAEIERLDRADDKIIDHTIKEVPTMEEMQANIAVHQHPENMEKPMLVGIIIDESPLVKNTYCYAGTIPVFGIIVNTQRVDSAINFLHFIFDESYDFTALTPYVTYSDN